jgi:hypothetical protein
MPQEISISQQAVKARIYKLIDAYVDGTKSEFEVQESIMRWWSLVHPQDREMARRYVLDLMKRANTGFAAIQDGLMASKNFQEAPRQAEAKLKIPVPRQQSVSNVI